MKKYNRHEKHWSDTKRYLHIGVPPTKKEKPQWVCDQIQDKRFISKYAFFPLIKRNIQTPRYRKEYSEGNSIKRIHSDKSREICYACHRDAMVYRYYSEILQNNYEEILKKNVELSKSIVAYRQLPIDDKYPERGNKCNIEFANDAFQLIKQSTEDKLFVGVYDITNFFNNLDHKLLKNTWIDVCGFDKELPLDHYRVFKNATLYSYVNEEDVFNLFKDRIVCEKSKTCKELVERKISKIYYLYNNKKRPIAYCKSDGLKEIKRKGLINTNKYDKKGNLRVKGIPQGLPISAVLANMYMLAFDKEIVKFMSDKTGIYRRYSDDIIVVCSEKHKKDIVALLMSCIEQLKLDIQPRKAKEYILSKVGDRYYCRQEIYPYRDKIEYLGFEFDGKRILLKSASLAGYYGRMNRAVRRSKIYSQSIRNKDRGKVFENQLFKRFTVYGAKRKSIYKQWKDREGKIQHIYIGKKSWGNYITYVKRAAKVMEEPAIKRQLKRHLPILRKKLNTTKF